MNTPSKSKKTRSTVSKLATAVNNAAANVEVLPPVVPGVPAVISQSGPLVTAATIDKADLAAIAVSRTELLMKKAMAEETTQGEFERKQAGDVHDKLVKLRYRNAKDTLSAVALAAAKAHVDLTLSSTPDVTISTSGDGNSTVSRLGKKEKERVHGERPKGRSDEKVFVYSAIVSYGGDGSMVNCTVRLYETAEMQSLRDQLDAHQKAAAKHEEAAVQWKRKLSDMGSLERHARAKLAEVSLKQTVQGQAILDQLTADLSTDVLRLT